MFDVIVIGAGAAGLYFAGHHAHENMLILEKNTRPGLKLLVSGSGACNVTHGGYMSEIYKAYGDKKAFVKPALSKHTNKDVMAFFEANGVPLWTREDGKVFPVSMQAKSILSALLNRIGDKILYGQTVLSIEVNGDCFDVNTQDKCYRAKNVIVACGGMSYRALGSDGSGYQLAKGLGHTIVPPKPGLTGVIIKDDALHQLMGLSFQSVKIEAIGDQHKTYEGDLLITHFGLSGPVILNNSRDFRSGDRLMVNFVSMSMAQLENNLLEVINDHGDKPLAYWLNQLECPERLIEYIKGTFEIDSQLKLAELTKGKRKELMLALTQMPFTIDKCQGFDKAMVTVGGVSVKEVTPSTLESTLHKGLFFIGEVVDVDGKTGGYNLQWAFSSAYSAGQHIFRT